MIILCVGVGGEKTFNPSFREKEGSISNHTVRSGYKDSPLVKVCSAHTLNPPLLSLLEQVHHFLKVEAPRNL